MLSLFKKKYPVRRYTPQAIKIGYASSAIYTDSLELLDVQMPSNNDLLALPEGERTKKRVKVFGRSEFAAADDAVGIRGDRLFYGGEWYKCVTNNPWAHTLLAHHESEWVLLPAAEQDKERPPEVVS